LQQTASFGCRLQKKGQKMNNKLQIPAARREGLVVRKLNDDVLIYDTKTNHAHSLNQNAALIWEHCDGKRTLGDLSNMLQGNVPGKEREQLTWIAIDQLQRSGLLLGQVASPESVKGMTRRQLIKAAGIAALIAVPVVSTIVAPKAAQASTCLASGQGCSSSAECCSGLCSANVCV
jgi:hypothetical protein